MWERHSLRKKSEEFGSCVCSLFRIPHSYFHSRLRIGEPYGESDEPVVASWLVGPYGQRTVLGTSGPANATPFTFNVTYDPSVAGAPAGFIPAFNTAIQFFENSFVDPITINLNVGWGEINGGGHESSIYRSEPHQSTGKFHVFAGEKCVD